MRVNFNFYISFIDIVNRVMLIVLLNVHVIDGIAILQQKEDLILFSI